MMGFRDLLTEVFSSLSANKMRSALTVLGIVIGISSVILMLALVAGYQEVILGEMGGEQANTLTVFSGGVSRDAYDRLEERVRIVEYVEGLSYGYANEQPTIEGKASDTGQGSILGAGADYILHRDLTMAAGRWFGESEIRGAQLVAVIGRGQADGFGVPIESLVGKAVTINGTDYRVVGILQASRMNSDGMSVFVPYTTLTERITGMETVDTAFIKIADDSDIDAAKETVKSFLADESGMDPEGIFVESMDALIEQIRTVMGVLQAILGSIASISLVVGGIGIMNMMLTNVTERIREIGLRKALGATRSTITGQFLAESIVLTVSGGLLGIFFGFVLAQAGGVIVRAVAPGAESFTPVITWWSVALSVGVSTLIGLVFGWYPARRAAKLDPIEALRFQ